MESRRSSRTPSSTGELTFLPPPFLSAQAHPIHLLFISPPPLKTRNSRGPPSMYSPLQAVPDYFASTFIVTPSPSIASTSPSSTSTTFPSFTTYYTPPKPPAGEGTGSIIVLHHGGGEGALGFSVLAKDVREGSEGELGVLSFDARGHGEHPSSFLSSTLQLHRG